MPFAQIVSTAYNVGGQPVTYRLRAWKLPAPCEGSSTARALAGGQTFSPFTPGCLGGAHAQTVPLLPAAQIKSASTGPSRGTAQTVLQQPLPPRPTSAPNPRANANNTPDFMPDSSPTNQPTNAQQTWSPPEFSSPVVNAVDRKAAASNAPRPPVAQVAPTAPPPRAKDLFGALLPPSSPPKFFSSSPLKFPSSPPKEAIAQRPPIGSYISSDDINSMSPEPEARNTMPTSNSKDPSRVLVLELTYLNNKRENFRIEIYNNVLRWDDLPYVLTELLRLSPDPVGLELRVAPPPQAAKSIFTRPPPPPWMIFGTTCREYLNPVTKEVQLRIVNRTRSFMVVDESVNSGKKRRDPGFFEEDTPKKKARFDSKGPKAAKPQPKKYGGRF